MKRFLLLLTGLILVASSSITIFAQNAEEMAVEGPIFEIAIRRIVDAENFATLNAEVLDILTGLDGFVGAREYTTFFGIPTIEEGEMYAVGITQWDSIDAYFATATLLEDPTVIAYFETIESIQNVVVQPFVLGEELTLDDLASSGQVLELAIRDISTYEDPVGFLRAIRGFTHQLTSLDGVVREFEWLSVDGQYFVGMTQYESMDAFMAASQNEALFTHPATAAVFSQYPPLIAQMTVAVE